MEFSSVFLTVGTTDFDELISVLNSDLFLTFLSSHSCQRLTVQYGRGKIVPDDLEKKCQANGIDFKSFRFHDSLDQFMREADLIICHAGAGSITEALSLKKKVMVVINESLMDNHQLELANAVVERGYCHSATPSTLLRALQQVDFINLKPYDEIDENAFPAMLDEMFGW